jgi:hypothetical protein
MAEGIAFCTYSYRSSTDSVVAPATLMMSALVLRSHVNDGELTVYIYMHVYARYIIQTLTRRSRGTARQANVELSTGWRICIYTCDRACD